MTEPAGITIGGFDVVLEFDPSRFTVSQAYVGDLFQGTDLVGAMTQPAPGKVIFSADSSVDTSRFPLGSVGNLLTLTVAIAADAAPGPATFNLLASLGSSRTGVFDADLQELVLNPPPTNAASDLGDGIVTVHDGGTPWHHADNPFDVNGDGLVTTTDVLAVIDYLNAILHDAALPNVAAGLAAYYDVNNDRLCTPQDVLAVINQLNAEPSPVAEGENGRFAAKPLAESRFAAGPRPAGRTSVGESPTEDLRDRLFGELETELSSLEDVLGELAHAIAYARR